MLTLLLLTAALPLPALAEGNEVTYIRRVYDSAAGAVVESRETVTNPLTTFPLMREGEYWYFAGESRTYESRITVPPQPSLPA